jgi:hypothetical protein
MKSKHQNLFVFWKKYLKPTFTIWNMKINAHYCNHILYLIIKMKTFNVPQFYNGFYCYFKCTCSNFDKVIKLFTLFCLHPPRHFIWHVANSSCNTLCFDVTSWNCIYITPISPHNTYKVCFVMFAHLVKDNVLTTYANRP